MEMSKGGWGSYIFVEIELAHDPKDMFVGKVFGAYVLSDLVPETKNCDEFINPSSHLSFFRI